VCSPALVAIANNVLKAGRHGTGSLRARMLFSETLTNLQNCSCRSDSGVITRAKFEKDPQRARMLKDASERKAIDRLGRSGSHAEARRSLKLVFGDSISIDLLIFRGIRIPTAPRRP
jgi:hypothetical protein